MSDQIVIRGLQVEAIVGLHAWERLARQRLQIDIVMELDVRDAALSGNVAKTVDYSAVAAFVDAFIKEGEFVLLETLAENAVAKLFDEFAADAITFSCTKLQVLPNTKGVGVAIRRSRNPSPELSV